MKQAGAVRAKSRIQSAVALALAANAPLIVHAQTDAAAASNSVGLQEITVTATRRTTSLQDAPVDLEVLGAPTLAALNISSFADYLKYTPGMQANGQGGPGTQLIEMRGVGAYGANVYQAGTIGGKASVAVYLDDTPVSAGASGTRALDLFVTDIDRVEVLGGPQGTLFGSASLAGAVRLITNQPNLQKFDGRVTMSGGWTQNAEKPNRDLEAMLNIPLIADRLALRIAAYDSYSAGFLDNTPLSQSLAINTTVVNNPARFANTQFASINNFNYQSKGMNDVEYKGARATAAFKITDDWRLTVQYTHQNLDTGGPFYSNSTLPDFKTVTMDNPNFLHDDVDLAAWTLRGRLARLNLIYSGSYLKRHIDQVGDYSEYTERGPFLPYYDCNPQYTSCQAPRSTWSAQSDLRTITHELRLESDPAERLSYIVGAYYHKNGCAPPACGTSIDFNYFGSEDEGFPPNTPIAGAQSYIPSARPPGTEFFTDASPTDQETSFFGDLTFKVTDKFSASIGARHYKTDQSIVGSVNFGSRTDPNSGVNFSDHLHPISESNYIKRATLTYKPADGVNLYATYSEGFSAGGYNRTGGVAGFNGFVVPTNYNTETTKNYEVGWKLLLDDRRLRINTAFYRMDWDNIVVGIFDPTIVNATFFDNAGKARIYGLEPQLSYLLNRNWSIDAALTWTDAKLVSVPSTVPDIVPAGSQLARQPRVAGNVRVRYGFALGNSQAYVMLSSVYKGRRWDAMTLNRTQSPPYVLFDLNLGTEWNNGLGVKLFAENLTDKHYETDREQSNLTTFDRFWGTPRTIGVTLSYDF